MEIVARESPLEGLGDFLVVVLEAKDTLGEIFQGCEVVRVKCFTGEDGEVDLDLVEPAGVRGKMDEAEPGVLRAQTCHSSVPPVNRAVINDPEDARRGSVGLFGHDGLDEPIKGFNG